MDKSRQKSNLILYLLLSACFFTGSFAVFRKNRIVNGEPQTAFQIFGPRWIAILALIIAAAFLLEFFLTKVKNSKAKEGLTVVQIGFLSTLLLLALVLIGNEALNFDLKFGKLTRVSPGYSFWAFVFFLFLLAKRKISELESLLAKTVSLFFIFGALLFPLLGGYLNSLSVLKEYENNKAIFQQEFVRHIILSLGSVVTAMIFGIPIGVIAARKKKFSTISFTSLNIIQVIPTLSLIGFLMIPLGYLGERFALAQELGIRGVGWAPAFIVLFLYAIYPITRNTAAAVASISEEYLEAARGIGLNPFNIFFKVELPLAALVISAGIRVALIQAAAGTILAALVGGGGLGIFIFLGLAQTAQDLVFLGLIPIVFLSFLYALIMSLIENYFLRGRVYGAYQS